MAASEAGRQIERSIEKMLRVDRNAIHLPSGLIVGPTFTSPPRPVALTISVPKYFGSSLRRSRSGEEQRHTRDGEFLHDSFRRLPVQAAGRAMIGVMDLLEVGTIDRDELARALRARTVRLVDVLSPESFAARHIPGAINLSVADISRRARQLLPDLDAPIVVYCGGPT
jgi:hypothetical protein